jgi:type I restriction enzyme S subunit
MTEPYKLPDGWKWVRLSEVCEICQYGYTAIASERGNFPYIRITDIDDLGNFKQKDVKFINCDDDTYRKYALKNGDILFARSGSIGRTFLYQGIPENAIFASYLIRFRINKDIADPMYVFHFTHSPEYYKFIEEIKHTVSQPNINAEEYKSLTIPLPPITEQRRIATKLQELMQDIEHARSACEKQLSAAKALPSAYLREVFESEEAKKWERRRLGEVCEHDSGVWGDEPDGSSECYFVLRSNNIKDGKMVFDEIAIRKVESKYVSEKSLKFGDILVTTSSGSKDLLGKSAIFIPPDDKVYLFSNFTMRLRAIPNVIDFFYLYFYLQSPEAKKVLQLIQDTTTGLRNLDRKEFLNQLIPLPPLSEQRRIAFYLQEKMAYVEKLRKAIENQLEAINTLPQAILRKAFRGEL